MAVGDTSFPQMLPVPGIRLGTAAAGFKYKNRDDLLLVEIAEGATTAAVFTRNAFCAAPVIIARQHLSTSATRYLLINSGNANCGLGQQGIDTANASCALLAQRAGVATEAVLPFSTGVIAAPMSLDCFRHAIPTALQNLHESNWAQAARAIMTTDTFAKGVSHKFDIDGQQITITGIAKGSGMIHPDMATMLAYVMTDANISQPELHRLLQHTVDRSFNCITVDGDTSTNDACILVATARAGASLQATALCEFESHLQQVMTELAQLIVRDGEGATRLMTVEVNAASSVEEARRVGFTVAHSPLVKTALFAADPNWGRILAAVGRAHIENMQIEAIQITLNDVSIVKDGARDPDYTEEMGQAAMRQDNVVVRIHLGMGTATATVWSCDLSYDYVRINAEYRS